MYHNNESAIETHDSPGEGKTLLNLIESCLKTTPKLSLFLNMANLNYVQLSVTLRLLVDQHNVRCATKCFDVDDCACVRSIG